MLAYTMTTEINKTLDAIVAKTSVIWDTHQDLLKEDGFDFEITYTIIQHSYKAYSYEETNILGTCFTELIVNAFKAIYGRGTYELRKNTDEEDKVILRQRRGKINVSLTPTNQEYIFSVQDNGDGIPPENYDTIFQIGFSTRNTGGIGLNLAKERIENLGGRIYFESVVNQGTTFCIELPSNSHE